MPINKEKIELREKVLAGKPNFVRPESWRYARLTVTGWRKPKGIDNHTRKQRAGRPKIVKVGYGTPKVARGLHPSGYTDNLVYNLNDLEKLDPKTDGLRIGHSVGTKKRKSILEKAMEKKFKVFNARVSKLGSKS